MQFAADSAARFTMLKKRDAGFLVYMIGGMAGMLLFAACWTANATDT